MRSQIKLYTQRKSECHLLASHIISELLRNLSSSNRISINKGLNQRSKPITKQSNFPTTSINYLELLQICMHCNTNTVHITHALLQITNFLPNLQYTYFILITLSVINTIKQFIDVIRCNIFLDKVIYVHLLLGQIITSIQFQVILQKKLACILCIPTCIGINNKKTPELRSKCIKHVQFTLLLKRMLISTDE